MMKKLVILSYFLIPVAFASCPKALPTNDVNFCSSFKSVAICYCTSTGLPAGLCQDMKQLYLRMIMIYGSLQVACERQKYTTPQDCMDNWNCYLHGGTDSTGKICSSTAKACQ